MSDGFELVVSGDKRTAYEMGLIANKALTIGQLRKIGRKGFASIRAQAKKNANRMNRADAKDISKAIAIKTPKSKRIRKGKLNVLKLGLRKDKLPTISKRTGRAYKAFGRRGVPVGLWAEMGTKERTKRGRIKAEWPVYRAYKQKRQKARLEVKRGIERRLNDYSNTLTKLDYRFR